MFSSIIKLAVVGSFALPILCQQEEVLIPTYYNEETACYGYITGNNTYTPGKLPEPRTCKSMDKWKDDSSYSYFYSKDYSPAPYRDSSCCSNEGASDLRSGRSQTVFFSGWSGFATGSCVAQTEMMQMMICDPDQGLHVDQQENALRVCLSTCEKWFEICGLPGLSFPDWLNYDDAQSMCENLWRGSGSDDCYPESTDSNWDNNFACESQLRIIVVDDDNCLSVEDPTDQLIAYYTQLYSGSSVQEWLDYPNGCDGEDGGSGLIGIIAGSIVGCLVFAVGLFLVYYFCNKDNSVNNANPSHENIKEEPYDETMEADIDVKSSVAPEPSAPPMSLRDIKPIPVPVQLSSVRIPIATKVYNPVFQNQRYKPSFEVNSPKVDEAAVEVAIPVPEPELTFVQKLDLRELEDQKQMGFINQDAYEKKKSNILHGA